MVSSAEMFRRTDHPVAALHPSFSRRGKSLHDFPDRGGSRQVLHFGTAYKLTPHQQIDFHVAVGISGAAAKNYIGIGYSVLFLPR